MISKYSHRMLLWMICALTLGFICSAQAVSMNSANYLEDIHNRFMRGSDTETVASFKFLESVANLELNKLLPSLMEADRFDFIGNDLREVKRSITEKRVMTTSVSPVPVPNMFWLLGSALVGLVAISKRK